MVRKLIIISVWPPVGGRCIQGFVHSGYPISAVERGVANGRVIQAEIFQSDLQGLMAVVEGVSLEPAISRAIAQAFLFAGIPTVAVGSSSDPGLGGKATAR